jgi:Second Messenger Oligonucleotide or Dinucleotide Synthetase domain
MYPQGSMRLGTTVKPIDGPHDLDFVCEFLVSHALVDPIALLDEMYELFKQHGVYGGMVEKKNRCVRIIYKDEFWLDILPACHDDINGGTCVQVPDQEEGRWKASNPIKYAEWFEKSSSRTVVFFSEGTRDLVIKASSDVQPLPGLQAADEKTILQLIVQLLKRWRDIHYADSSFPPISIVLTTLAAELYSGSQSIALGLLEILEGIVARMDAAHALGKRLEVPNPVHREEDFSERWNNSPRAYLEFNDGIRKFAKTWRETCLSQGNPNRRLEDLFGDVLNTAVLRQAKELQGMREAGQLGIKSSGLIVPAASAITTMLPNTNHGEG